MFFHPHRNKTIPQDTDAGNEQPDEVHDMFPFQLSLITKIGLYLLELRHHVAVVRLIDQPRQED